MAVRVRGVGEGLGQLVESPCVILQVLFVLRIHGLELTVESICKEQWRDEELGKTVQCPVKMLVANLKVVVGGCRSGVGIRGARMFR